MSNSDFSTTLVKDSRLDLNSTIKYAVMKGAQNVVAAVVKSPAPSTSAITFNVMVPSEQIVMSRKVLWKSQFVIKIEGNPALGTFLTNIGVTDALSPFPAHQMVNSLSCTINNATVTSNTNQILSAMLRMGDKRKLNRFNSGCPTAYDTLADYADGIGSNNNVLGAYSNSSMDNDYHPRGAFVLDYVGEDPLCVSLVLPQRVGTAVDTQRTTYVKFTTSEHLMMSPFLFGDVADKGGMYGIRALNFNVNMSTAQRVWRSTSVQNVSLYKVESSELHLEYLTPHSSDLFDPKCVVPYYELPIYKTTILSVPIKSTQEVVASALQLSSIPDRLIIFCRKQIGEQKSNDTDSFLTVNKVNINWNNNAGLLSSYTQNQLYCMCVENGSNQSWEEFSGKTFFSDASTGMGRVVPTSGSVLVLEMGRDIQLSSDYEAPSLLGSFNLQVSLNVTNNSNKSFDNGELCIIAMTSGVLVTSAGQTQSYTGVLTRQNIIDASQTEAVYHDDVHRMVGGGFWDTAKAIFGKIAPHAKKYLLNHDHKYANTAGKVLGALGYGHTGGKKLSDRLL